MDGTVSYNKYFKTIHIIFTFLDFMALLFFAYRTCSTQYTNIFQYARLSGIEHLPFYFCVTIILLIAFITFIGILLFCKKYNKKLIIVYSVFMLLIIIATIIGVKIPHETEYISSDYNQAQSDYFPIDKYEYKENSKDYYFYREVNIGKIYWIGSSSYKDFAAESTLVDLTEDVSNSSVTLSYYYLFDESNYLIKDYLNKEKWYDVFDDVGTESEETIDNYTIREYDDSYELTFESKDEVFCLSASKNKRTKYDEKDLVRLANELMTKLRQSK